MSPTPETADTVSEFLPTMQAELEKAESIRAKLDKEEEEKKAQTPDQTPAQATSKNATSKKSSKK